MRKHRSFIFRCLQYKDLLVVIATAYIFMQAQSSNELNHQGSVNLVFTQAKQTVTNFNLFKMGQQNSAYMRQ